MKRILKFKISKAEISLLGENYLEEIKSFLEQLGYSLIADNGNKLRFKAGSRIGTLFSFNPQKIERFVELEIQGEYIKFISSVNLKWMLISKKSEKKYQNWEFSLIKSFLKGESKIDLVSEISKSDFNIFILFKNYFYCALRTLFFGSLILVAVNMFTLAINWMFSFFAMTERIALPPPSVSNRAERKCADVYLLPYGNFSLQLAQSLAQKLSEDLKLNVRITSSLPIPKDSFNDRRKQYDAGHFYLTQINTSCSLMDIDHETVFIGLIDGSLYHSDISTRFLFALEYDKKNAIVGNGNIKWNVPESVYHTRLYKLVKRQIGKTYFKKEPSSDKKSVMKSPIMSVRDLDKIGLEL